MKRWIYSSTTILGMSIPRNKAISKIGSFSDRILEHVCKAVMYGDSTGDYKHWVDQEIATWLYVVGDITIKPSGKKLKASDYRRAIFDNFGDSRADARVNLYLTYFKCEKENPPYPEVEITDDMINNLAKLTLELTGEFPELLAHSDSLSKSDIADRLHSTMDKYCLKEEI